MLVWDYRTGTVINPETGEVTDVIYVATPIDGFSRTYNSSTKDRVHYAIDKPLKFDVKDPVAKQIKELKLTPTWKITYSYLKRFDGKKHEKKLLSIYTEVMNYLSQYRSLSDEDSRIVAKIVRDASSEVERAYRGLGSRAKNIAAAAAIYIARMVLGIASLDLYRIKEGLDLTPRDIDKVLEVVRKLSIRYKVGRYSIIAREIERATQLLGMAELEIVAKTLLKHYPIDGKPSKSVAAGLLYLAALLLGRDGTVTERMIAGAVGVREDSVRREYRKAASVLGIEIARRAHGYGAVEYIDVPARLCKEFKELKLDLSSYVYCYW